MSDPVDAIESLLQAPGDFRFLQQLPEATAQRLARGARETVARERDTLDREIAGGLEKLPAALRAIVRFALC